MKLKVDGKLQKFQVKHDPDLNDGDGGPVGVLTIEAALEPSEVGELAMFLGQKVLTTLESAQQAFNVRKGLDGRPLFTTAGEE